MASSWFKAGVVPAADAPSPGGVCGAAEVATGYSLCFVVRPFGRPTPGGLLWLLLTSAPSRLALPPAALHAALRVAAGFFARGGQHAPAPGSWYPG